MMETDTDMDNMNRDREEEEEAGEQEEEETSFTDDQRRDESILIIDGSNPLFFRPGAETMEGETSESYNNPLKETVIHNTKQFIGDAFGISVGKYDGPYSTTLYDELIVTRDDNNRINGAKYKGSKIIVADRNTKTLRYSTDKRYISKVAEFKEILMKADKEHQKTPAALVERHVGVDVTQDTMDDIIDNVSDRIGSEIDDMVEDFTTNTEMTNNELRELRGILNVKGSSGENKLEALKVETEHWRKEAEKEGDTSKGKLYEAIAKVGELKADEIRLRLNQKPESEEVTKMVEEEAEVNDLTRFEKFKRWARENLLALSATAISVAGILTTVIMAGRSALKRGAQAAFKFGKAVANLAKKFGPVLSALGTLVAKVLTLGAQGILFLAKNLWILVLALTYFAYNEYVKNRGR